MEPMSAVSLPRITVSSNFSMSDVPEKKKEDAGDRAIDLLSRFSVSAGAYVNFGAADYPEEVGGRIKITNLNGQSTSYEDIVNDEWSELGLVAGVGFMAHKYVTIGYDCYWSGLGERRIGEYRYHWSDASQEISDTNEGEIEYIKKEPMFVHNPYLKVNMPFFPFLYARAGYRLGEISFVQGKETYGEEHDAGTIYRGDLHGYDVALGFTYPLSSVSIAGELGFIDMRGEDMSYQAGTLQFRINVGGAD